MEETVDVMLAQASPWDASHTREFSFHGDLRDILAVVKRHAAELHDGNEIMEVVENDEGLPKVEFRSRANPSIINQAVFATRKYGDNL